MQRLGDHQRLVERGHAAGIGQLAGGGVDQRRGEQVLRHRAVALEKDRVVMARGPVAAGEADELRALARQCRLRRSHRRVERAVALGRERRVICIGGGHRGDLAIAPTLDQRIGEGVDRPGQPDHRHPGQRDHAEEIVLVEPLDPLAAGLAHGSERQPPHEGSVEYGARDQREHEQQAHRAQHPHAGLAEEHVGVQLQQEVHQGIARCGPQRGAAGTVEEQQRHFRARRIGRGPRGDGQQRAILAEGHEQRHFARPLRQRGREHRVEREAGFGGGRPRQRAFGIAAHRGVDLVVKDQRQPRHAQHQQERRANQAAPSVNQIPGSDRVAGHKRPAIGAGPSRQ